LTNRQTNRPVDPIRYPSPSRRPNLSMKVALEGRSLTATTAPTANATTAPLTVAPVSTYFDGVLQGNLNVTSASGCGLVHVPPVRHLDRPRQWNINTAIPVTLDGKERTVEAFPIANIAYTAGQEIGGSNSLTLQILANSSLYQNNAVIWSVDISDVSVILPTTSTVEPNPFTAFLG
jgi:hypothetical protein